MDAAAIRFRKTPFVKQHQEAVSTIASEAALDASLVQFLEMMPTPGSSEQAAANFYRLEGARLFRDILVTIADAPEPRAQRTTGNLHNV